MSSLSTISSSSSHHVIPTPQIHPEHGSKHTEFSSVHMHSRTKVLSNQQMRLHIFDFLSSSTLMNCCVNRIWKNWTDDETIWRARLPQNIRDDFTPLVMQDLISWKTAHRYARLPLFIASIIEYIGSHIRFIYYNNPQLIAHCIHMRQPFVQYGIYQFVICNLTDIEVNKERNLEPFVLKDKTGKKLTHLAVENAGFLTFKEWAFFPQWNHKEKVSKSGNLETFLLEDNPKKELTNLAVEGDNLFALRRDGVIVHWNYKTRERIGEICTTHSQEREESQQKIRFLPTHEFYVRNGMIIIVCMTSPDTRSLEIISYRNPTEKLFIKEFPLNSNLSYIEVLEGNQIIILGDNNSRLVNDRFIWKRELSTTTGTSMPSAHHHLIWTTLAQQSLEKTTKKYDHREKGYPIFSPSPLEHMAMQTCTVIENLVFKLDPSNNIIRVRVIKMDSENPEELCRLDMSDFPQNLDTSEWRANLLACSIIKAKKGFDRAATSSTSTSISIHNPNFNEINERYNILRAMMLFRDKRLLSPSSGGKKKRSDLSKKERKK